MRSWLSLPANPSKAYDRALSRNSVPFVALLVAAISVASFLLRVPFINADYHNPDEPIATGVVSGVLNTHTLDTNWKNFDVYIGSPPNWFLTEKVKYYHDQYNFSSYYLFLAAIGEAAHGITGRPMSLKEMRLVSMLLATLLIPCVFLLGNALGGTQVGVTGAFLTALSPQLFQSSLYARPESFFTLLFVLATLVAVLAKGVHKLLLVASAFLFGLLVACKVSALSIAPIPLGLAITQDRDSWRSLAAKLVICSLGLAVGVIVGVPYAIVNFPKVLSGIHFLLVQYASGSGPTGVHDQGSLIERLGYLGSYLAATVGTTTLILAAVGTAFGALDRRKLIIAACTFGSLLYLGTRHEFYERNFDNCLPLLFVFAAIGLHRVLSQIRNRGYAWFVGTTLVTLAALPMVQLTKTIQVDVLSGAYQAKVTDFQQRYSKEAGGQFIICQNLVYGDAVGSLVDYLSRRPFPFVIEFAHDDDRYSARALSWFVAHYQATKLGEIRDPFSKIPPSTLQVYLARSYVVYRVTGLKPTFQ